MRLREFLGVKRSSLRIQTNNYCNLHCEHCCTMCHVPIHPDSEYVDRRTKWDVSLKTIELFCERFKGIGERNLHRLAGGETTAMPLDTVEELVEILYVHNRRMSLLTNGYDLLGLSRRCLDRIHDINLDDHGINHEHIMRCYKYLKENFDCVVGIITTLEHKDWDCARKHPENILTEPCDAMMRSPTMYREAIYPCCQSQHTDVMRKDMGSNKALKDAGWTVYNPDIVETLRNWRTTLPEYVLHKCLTDCPSPYGSICGKTRITLKPNDVIWRQR